MTQQPESTQHSGGPTFALAAAALFGVSTPFAKLIGEDLNAFLLAGLLYRAQVWVWQCGDTDRAARQRRREKPHFNAPTFRGWPPSFCSAVF